MIPGFFCGGFHGFGCGQWSVVGVCVYLLNRASVFSFFHCVSNKEKEHWAEKRFYFVNLGYMCETLPSGASVRNERAAGLTDTREKMFFKSKVWIL